MSIQLSQAVLAELMKQESGEAVLALLTLSHPSWGEPVRIVNNNADVISRGNRYLAFPFQITLPKDDGESDRQATVVIDNSSLELIGALRSVTNEIPATIEIIMASLPDTVQIEYTDLVIRTIRYNKSAISATLTLDNFMNTELTSEKYTPAKYPGLF